MVMMAMVMMKMMMMMTHIGEGVGLLGSALSLAGGVTQCKDDGSFIEACHILDDLISEGSGYSSSAWKRGHSLTYCRYYIQKYFICLFIPTDDANMSV